MCVLNNKKHLTTLVAFLELRTNGITSSTGATCHTSAQDTWPFAGATTQYVCSRPIYQYSCSGGHRVKPDTPGRPPLPHSVRPPRPPASASEPRAEPSSEVARAAACRADRSCPHGSRRSNPSVIRPEQGRERLRPRPASASRA